MVGLCLASWAAVAAVPGVPSPVLSKPEAPPSSTNAASAVVTNALPAPRKLADPAPASGPTASAKGTNDAEVAVLAPGPDAPHRGKPAANEFVLAGRKLFPADSYWSEAFGGEVQWRHWVSEVVGFAVSGGMQTWTLRDTLYIISPSHETHPTVTGSASITPIGASLLLRWPAAKDAVRLTAELGLRYLLISSDATMYYDYQNMFDQRTFLETEIEFDNRPVGVAAIEIGGALGRHVAWFLAGGYQMDSGGGENWLFEKIANDFSGAVAGAGFRWIP